MTSGNTYLSTPTDYLSTFSLALKDSSNNFSYLLLKQVSFIRDYTPQEATTGKPLYYAQFDDNTFIVAPTPNANFSVELHYYYRPASVTSLGDSEQSWLSENAPNALLFGALVEGGVFMKLDPQAIAVYESKYQEALSTLKVLGEFKNLRDEARNDQQKLNVGGMNV